MASEGIPVNVEIIAWGRKRAGLTLEEATQKFRHFPKGEPEWPDHASETITQ
jgi:hypothetical protein